MLEAFGWGLLAQSSLLLAGLLVCWVTVPSKVVGILGGFGAGAMIAAVSFAEATAHIQPWHTGLWMLVGVAVFLLADQLVERRFGSQGAGGAMGIIVGSVVDGVPESAILGIQVGIGSDGSASSGYSWSWPAASPPPSVSWPPTYRGPCRATARRPSRREVYSRCSRTH